MRKPLLAGNMKMFKKQAEVKALGEELKSKLSNVKDREILMCPPYTSLGIMRDVLKGSNIALGGQNIFWEKEGAYTGEVSAEMLADAGCRYVIIGHSERRQYFNETDENVNKKIRAAQRAGLMPVICVGEILSQRESGKTFAVVETQLTGALQGITVGNPETVIIAYEPVWAIGTGKTATPQQAQEVHSFIRKKLSEIIGSNEADGMRILYGGSVKPESIKGLMAQPDIDGGLVGGACLKAEQFAQIVQY